MTKVEIKYPVNSNAALIALAAHHGQVDKMSGQPYFDHLKRVAESFESPVLQAIGFLHDIIEDTGATMHTLQQDGIPFEVIEAVLILTRRKDDTYTQFISRIIASRNKKAMLVKLADLKDNKRDLSGFPDSDVKEHLERKQKHVYTPARIRLEAALSA